MMILIDGRDENMEFLDNARTLYTNGLCVCLDGAPIKYIINEGDKDSYTINSNYHNYMSNVIIDEGSFVNGFKVVKLDNGKYSYVREKDNKLMDYYFDVALNFNEYNMAMVGKNGSVMWINSDFKYLDGEGNRVQLQNNRYVNGWQKLYEFTNDDIPLARVMDSREYYYRVGYVDLNMKLKEFKEFNGTINDNKTFKVFGDGSDFENNVAILNDRVLLAKGYYISYKDLINYLKEDDILKNLENAIEQLDNPKCLKRVK